MARTKSTPDLGEGWLPMSSAPRDGSLILVCELPGGADEGHVMPAAFLNRLGGGEGQFWGVLPTSHLPVHLVTQESVDAVRAMGLPVDFRAIALTPLCWKPLPLPEAYTKLRRREAAILALKFSKKGP